MTLDRGALLNNRYRVQEILGQGGMGAVYRAVDENLGMEVALKENLFTTDEYARQFRREAVILATLRHPNLTRVTDHFVIEDQGQYLVMDYIEGEDLRQRMDRAGLIKEEEVIIIGAAICDALTYLHTRTPPIVHRDIKPGNVKITPAGQIYLVDFGLAKIIHTDQVTTTGARAMTPGYSPPEQYGTARTDSRSDLFSLGATLYAALTGTIPEDALARAMDQTDLTQIRKRNPRVSRRLASVIEKALAVRPDERYQTADEFKQALLNVRGITTSRRMGEYHITPPPNTHEAQPIYANPAPAQNGPAEFTPTPREQLPLPSSTPILELASSPRDPPARFGSGIVLFIVILAVVGLVAYQFYPAWPGQAARLMQPILSMAGLVDTATLRSIATSETPALTPTIQPLFSPTPAAPSATLAIVLPPEASATITPSPQPTSTFTPRPPTETPTPLPTALGGGSGQIAFASDRSGKAQIWLMNVDGAGEPQQLTDLVEGACQPAWSPDGLQIVFISPCEGNQDFYPNASLYTINADGSDFTPLSGVPVGDFDPSWSLDGKSILFTSYRNALRPRVYLLTLADNSVKALSGAFSLDYHPAWSPDGRKIAFVTTQKGPVQVWTMNADGSNQQIFSRSGDAINKSPVWSRDGQFILFTQQNIENFLPSLVVGSYVEGDYKEFKFNLGPTPAREARYSPDGLWLVFEAWPSGGNHDVYLMSASGSGRVKLTDWERNDFDPAWRPAVLTP
jgi:serine/threonine protein kinase